MQGQRPRGGLQPAADTLEQRHLQHLLEPGQFAADRGLRGVQQHRRPGDLAGGHDGAKHLDLPVGELHP